MHAGDDRRAGWRSPNAYPRGPASGRGESSLAQQITKADQDVGVERDHLRVADRRIAASMSSRLTPLTRGLTTPKSDIKSIGSGRISTTPSSRTRKDTRCPVSRESASRTSFGMVIWPLLVMVALGILTPLSTPY